MADTVLTEEEQILNALGAIGCQHNGRVEPLLAEHMNSEPKIRYNCALCGAEFDTFPYRNTLTMATSTM